MKKDLVCEKQLFVIGDKNIYSFDCESNNIVKNFFNASFKNGIFQLLQDLLELQGIAQQ